MNARDRFLSIMSFEPGDRTLLWEFGYWGGTPRRWYTEGLDEREGVREDIAYGTTVSGEALPAAHVMNAQMKSLFPTKDVRDQDVHDALGLDAGLVMMPINTSLCPPFTPGIVEERGDTHIEIDGFGVTKQMRKTADCIPRFVGWPVETRKDFEELKERLKPGLAARAPDNWAELASEYHSRDFPLVAGFCGEGFFGNLRRFMGDVKLCISYYDDPKLLHTMNAYFADFWIGLWDEAFQSVKPDGVWFWEDMCYKNGPMISPALFRLFMLPYYQKVNRFLDDHGVKIRLVDTDGDCWQLIPLFLEAGITGLSPFEVAAGMDVVKVREAFPTLQILGGFDKKTLSLGRDAIDAELGYKLPPMLERGGYIPHVDHLVPPDVPWENFKYYRHRLREMVEGRF